jgi:hypothetical protein
MEEMVHFTVTATKKGGTGPPLPAANQRACG